MNLFFRKVDKFGGGFFFHTEAKKKLIMFWLQLQSFYLNNNKYTSYPNVPLNKTSDAQILVPLQKKVFRNYNHNHMYLFTDHHGFSISHNNM